MRSRLFPISVLTSFSASFVFLGYCLTADPSRHQQTRAKLFGVETAWGHSDGTLGQNDLTLAKPSQTWASYSVTSQASSASVARAIQESQSKMGIVWRRRFSPALLVSGEGSGSLAILRGGRWRLFLLWEPIQLVNTHGRPKQIRCCCKLGWSSRDDVLSRSATARERQECGPRKLKALWRHSSSLDEQLVMTFYCDSWIGSNALRDKWSRPY